MSQTRGRRLLWSLSALCVAGVVTYGARGSFGLFIEPWERAFHASRATVSLVSAVGFVALGLGQPIAGKLLQRWDARVVLVAGIGLCALGFAGAAFARNAFQAIVLAGGVASFGAGLASMPTLSYLAAGMTEKRTGTVFGILTAANAGGQVVVLPMATVVLGVSLRAVLLFLGGLLALAVVTVALLVPSTPPERKAGRPPVTVGTIARERRFWLLLVPFFVCGYTSTGLTDTHLIPYALDHHIAEATASAALATLAAFNVAGVLVAGLFTDRIDRGRMLAAIYASRAGIVLLLPALTSSRSLFLFAALFGLADYATVPPTTSLTRTVFRSGGWGLALGLISAAHQAGSALGAWLGGLLYSATGTYGWSFSTGAAGLLVAAALSYGLREPAEPKEPSLEVEAEVVPG